MGSLKQIGTVEEVSEIVCLIRGLPHASMDEEVIFESGAKGMVLRLDEDYVYAVLLSRENTVIRGAEVICSGEALSVPVGDSLLGRVVNPLGEPVDGKSILSNTKNMPIERIAPSIFQRQPITKQLETGITLIDAMMPLGKGQRETIIGDPKSGKSNSVYTAVINLARMGIISVYVTIGKPQAKTKAFVEKLRKEGVLDKVVIVMGTASMSPTMNFVAPYAGMTIAEHFLYQGKDVLIIFDDLSQHAKYYRQMSLLLKRSPGREAYPGDVFFVHSRLLERAAVLNKDLGGGSITALPIIEIQERDLTGYVPTNVLSITDGHMLYDIGLFNQNVIPSIALELSVSRLGGKVQCPIIKKLGNAISQQLMYYRAAQAFAHFGTDLATETKQRIERGKRIIEFLKQEPYEAIKLTHQMVMLHGLNIGVFDTVRLDKVKELRKQISAFLQEDERWKAFTESLSDKKPDDVKDEFKTLFDILSEKFINACNIVEATKTEGEENQASGEMVAQKPNGRKEQKIEAAKLKEVRKKDEQAKKQQEKANKKGLFSKFKKNGYEGSPAVPAAGSIAIPDGYDEVIKDEKIRYIPKDQTAVEGKPVPEGFDLIKNESGSYLIRKEPTK
ncbi:F0F1 ATP synthase subunit alpha [Candidatus Wirthbacteria bacterium CG2_30_54_11]|uniref:F0F1 ATP synthase subunit alpha n=1 Tax=Candidatus Wirthbacteria bacterium CG2_30_54_11 TaxID=1817892 RepID=A0A1J5ITE5_9BACT|nr:MAG: F0F1 ATP synthase subunit alpha [Candidatus Wirthbacteria bacterium CG2_30_54_11]